MLKEYRVCFTVIDHYEIKINAESKEEAKQELIDRWNNCEEVLDVSEAYAEDFGEVTDVYTTPEWMNEGGNILVAGAKKTVRVKGIVNDNPVELDIRFYVHESGASDYGNRTMTTVEYDWKGDVSSNIYDTRYFRGNLRAFTKWYVDNELNSTFSIIGD